MSRRSCFDCDYCDERDIQDRKVWCGYYKNYYDPEDGYDCRRFEIKKSSSGPCYLTTACVGNKKLSDDCRELAMMRKLRDDYIALLPNGEAEISDYYATAPDIVGAIDARTDAGPIYDELYDNSILPCVELVEVGENEKAYEKYKEMVAELKEKYC